MLSHHLPPQNKILITHVKMLHTIQSLIEGNADYGFENQIAASQFKIAKTILSYPEKIVVHEGCYEKLSLSYIDIKIKNKIKKHFNSSTFKEKFINLTREQKKLLIKFHGAFIIYNLGLINDVYPSISKVNYDLQVYELENNKQKGIDKLLKIGEKWKNTREHDAILSCKHASKTTGVCQVLLIYGREHNFNLLEQDDEILFTDTIDVSTSKTAFIQDQNIINHQSPSLQIKNKNKHKEISNYFEPIKNENKETKVVQINPEMEYNKINNKEKKLPQETEQKIKKELNQFFQPSKSTSKFNNLSKYFSPPT